MQKLTILAFMACCTMGLFMMQSCSKQTLPVPPQPSSFSASLKTYTEFPAAGAKDTIVIGGGSNGWWVSVPASNWMVVSKLYGSGDFKLPVEAKANTSGAPREIELKVSPTFGQAAVVIKVKQTN